MMLQQQQAASKKSGPSTYRTRPLHGRMAEWSKAVDSRDLLFRALLGFGAFYSANAGVDVFFAFCNVD
uniref:DUF1279 domain-containing protein n=1 Tax=Panagrellus redivivus TaxID=6233 RepID=A0A7E4WD30_PANRE